MNDALPIAWAKLFLRAAFHAGIREVVLSPGSRSTPLAIAAAEIPGLQLEVIVDERSAGFYALGQARLTGRPSLLVCTSGTAGAHYFPAIIEASMSCVPLIAVTADRPWELMQVGASQTIDQSRLFGGFVRGFYVLGAPEPGLAALRAVARTAAQAVTAAMGPHPGPVQVNAPFRKPLEPLPQDGPQPWNTLCDKILETGPTRAIAPRPASDPSAVREVAALVAGAERGLVVCGPAPASGDVDAYIREVTALSALLAFPLCAEATSQLRFGGLGASLGPDLLAKNLFGARTNAQRAPDASERAPVMLGSFDALFRSRGFRQRFAPDVIVEIGAPPVSAGYEKLLTDNPRCRRAVISPSGWTDPSSTASILINADVPAFLAALREHLCEKHLLGSTPKAAPYAEILADQDRRAASCISAEAPYNAHAPLTEAAIARGVVASCPPGSVLMIGNSSPVRDADMYAAPSAVPLRVLHQRGAAGIDGLVSAAAGAQSVSVSPLTLWLGDLSFLHDVGGLATARKAKGPLAIVIVSNGGGRIFEQLPIGDALGPGEAFERLFATPEPLDLAALARSFGVLYTRATTGDELSSALLRAHEGRGATVIEACVAPHEGARLRKSCQTAIDRLFTLERMPVS